MDATPRKYASVVDLFRVEGGRQTSKGVRTGPARLTISGARLGKQTDYLVASRSRRFLPRFKRGQARPQARCAALTCRQSRRAALASRKSACVCRRYTGRSAANHGARPDPRVELRSISRGEKRYSAQQGISRGTRTSYEHTLPYPIDHDAMASASRDPRLAEISGGPATAVSEVSRWTEAGRAALSGPPNSLPWFAQWWRTRQ